MSDFLPAELTNARRLTFRRWLREHFGNLDLAPDLAAQELRKVNQAKFAACRHTRPARVS